MMTPSEVFQWPAEFWKRHWKAILVILGIIIFITFLKSEDLPKFETSGISGVLADQNGIMIAGAIIVSIIILYLLRKILRGILTTGIILALAFLGYQKWDSIERGWQETVRILNNGIAKNIFIGKVEDLPIKIETSDMETGYYRLSIYPDPGKESYWGDCDEGKSLRGHAVDNESVRKRVENSREGNIVVMSGTGRSRHKDLVYVQKNSSFTVTLDLAGITVGKNCVINLGARLHFIPEKV